MIEITPLKIISYFPLRFKTSFLTCFSVLISRLEMGIIYLIHILIHFFLSYSYSKKLAGLCDGTVELILPKYITFDIQKLKYVPRYDNH